MSRSAFLPGQLRLILAITLVHIVAWFIYYSQIPAGIYPGEDARATVDAALALAEGLPAGAPGHSLYTYALSGLARFFSDAGSLTFAARGLNALAFIIATSFCASAAGHYWRRNRAVWMAGLLVGLNPVLLFWAGEVCPSLLATACLSMAFWLGLPWLRHPKVSDSVWIALSLILAALLETTLLPIALLWPGLACLLARRKRILHLVVALLPLAVGFGLILISNLQLQESFQWNFDQVRAGMYQALGNQESYDGKSFSLYRQLHFILFLNPIHWGALIILATGGAYARLKEGHRGRSILLAVSTLALFAVSFALNSSGSQARACLVPLLAILAAGVTLLPKIWSHASQRTRLKMIIGTTLVSLFAYAGSIFGTPQSDTWEHDYVYLAEANIQLGNNQRAIIWAEKALELNPTRDDMQEVIVIAHFNEWAIGSRQRTLTIENTKDLLEMSRQLKDTATISSIQGIYLYKLRETRAATTTWQGELEESALALLCLYWTGTITELTPEAMKTHEGSPYYDLLEAARQVDRNALAYGETEKLLDNILAFAY